MLSSVWFLPFAFVSAIAWVCPPNICDTVECKPIESCVNGYVQKNGGFCSCCDSCVRYIEEGQICVREAFAPVRTECGNGLRCNLATGRCDKIRQTRAIGNDCRFVRNKKMAIRRAKPWIFGLDVPQCDSDGTYSAVQCRNYACFCAEKYYGYQLRSYRFSPGEASNSACNCAREESALQTTVGKRVSCDRIGNYNSIQCEGSVCYCVNRKSGARVGISVPRNQIARLNC